VRPAIFGEAELYRRRFERLAQLADVVKLSDDDAAWIYPGLPVEDVLRLILDFGPRLVAVTRGENGAVAGSRNGFADVAGIPVEVVDTVGAGDSFMSSLLFVMDRDGALGAGAAPPSRDQLGGWLDFAARASAITCTRKGSDPPTLAEVEAAG